MNIKTITSTEGVNEVDFGSNASRFYWFQNLGTTTVHVSGNADIVAGGDGVAELAAGDSVCIETLGGKVYVLGAGKVQIHNTGDKFCPFKNAPAAGGGGGNSYTKSESDAKYAQKTDIPTTLPANGGNADTVNGLKIKSMVLNGTTNADGVCQLGMAIDKYQVLAIVGNTVDEHDLVFTPWIWGLPDPNPSMWGFSVTEFSDPLTRKINIPFSITVYYVEL